MKKNILSIVVLLLVIGGAVYVTKYKKISIFPQQTIQHVVTNTQTSPTLGTYLANKNGLTLYVNTKNPTEDSVCDFYCMKYWKPFIVDVAYTGDADFLSKKYNLGDKITMVKRADGLYQYAYDGKLLYTYITDQKAGDVYGLNINKGDWAVVSL